MKRIELSRRTLTVRAIGGLTALAVANKIDSVIAAPQIVALPDEGGEAPWDYWLSEKSAGVVRIASAGILSANPYNTQPWLFRLSDDRIEVLADLNRNLAVLDSLRRELYIGLGCAIENASVAAPSQGLAANVSLRMDAQTNLAAIINLGPSKTAKHLHHDAIALRHTHRGAYHQDRNVERQTLDALMRQVSSADTRLLLIDASTPDGRSHADLINEATETIIATPDLRDGRHIGIRGSIPRTTTDLEEAYRNADAAWVRANHTVSCATAVMFGLIMVRGSRTNHILHMEAGRLWQRLHLEGTVRELAMQPMNHLMEVIDYDALLQRPSTLKSRMNLKSEWDGWEPIFGFRFGYANAPAPRSPRRPLAKVVIS